MSNQRNTMKIWWMSAFFLLVGMVLVASAVQETTGGGQETTDIVAADQLKDKLRGEIVGKTVFPGEDKEYVIGHGDVLSVNVYGEGNMAATGAGASVPALGGEGEQQGEARGNVAGGAVVRMDGRVSLLHVGDVNVLGMTMTQATEYLKKLYATVYSNPMVSVALLQSNSRRYTVMGQVRAPGVFNLDFPITVVQAIARSGGFTEWADHDITVVRAGDGVKTSRGEGGKNTHEFDYDDLVKGKNLDKNIYINSGDVLIVH
jgi:polysaccharide biosynthesis/export protein